MFGVGREEGEDRDMGSRVVGEAGSYKSAGESLWWLRIGTEYCDYIHWSACNLIMHSNQSACVNLLVRCCMLLYTHTNCNYIQCVWGITPVVHVKSFHDPFVHSLLRWLMTVYSKTFLTAVVFYAFVRFSKVPVHRTISKLFLRYVEYKVNDKIHTMSERF